ncbi:MAG: DUF4251 domain-containing protein [Eudoraea sp.]|uniref:DUF4251 domain-containing protein n=1 Tax=Eudoraea sp. TaxID=1979955 RepID=UPI00326407D2
MRYRLVILGLMVILWSCGSSEKAATTSIQNQVLDNLVAQKSFIIESEWAQPMNTNAMNSVASSGLLPPGNSGSNISLIGNPNYLKVEGDTISAYLPFFGERQMTGGYGDRNAIEFKGVPNKFKSSKNSNKNTYTLLFSIKEKTEVYKVTITLFNNLNSHIHINSSQRNFIRYIGKVSELPKEDVSPEGL